MGRITDECADKIVDKKLSVVDVPHPNKKGHRIIGVIVPETEIEQGVSTLALTEILKQWQKSRRFGAR